MLLQKASRKRAKIRMSIQGPSGSGKTYGALLIAYGLSGDLSKVCIIDTENSSAELYAHLGDYNTLQAWK
jgi:Rad3-related DNA helicase